MDKKVSIIIPTFKRSDRLDRAIRSALNQNYSNFEVIVVDDNIKDTFEKKKTKELVQKYAMNEKFIFISHDDNKNGSAARNTGIKASSGEYITFLDDDDEYYSNKIAVQVNVLENLSCEWGICYTAYDKIDQYGNIQKSSEYNEGNVLVQALTKNLFLGSGSNFMIRKSVVNEVNGFDESYERNQDLEFLVRVLMKYKIKFVNSTTFLVHNEIRERIFTFDELIEINKQYRQRFSYFISKLNHKDKMEVNKTLDLWDIRAAITHKKIREIIEIYKRSELSIIDVSKYVVYLLNRIFSKKSYGFRLNKTEDL